MNVDIYGDKIHFNKAGKQVTLTLLEDEKTLDLYNVNNIINIVNNRISNKSINEFISKYNLDSEKIITKHMYRTHYSQRNKLVRLFGSSVSVDPRHIIIR